MRIPAASIACLQSSSILALKCNLEQQPANSFYAAVVEVLTDGNNTENIDK